MAEEAAEALEPEWKRPAWLEARAQTEVRHTPRPQAEADLDMPPLAAAVVGQGAVVALTTAPMAARRRH